MAASNGRTPSRTLWYAATGSSSSVLDGGAHAGPHATIPIIESGGAGLEDARRALYSHERLASKRIHWMFSPTEDERVASLLEWIQAMSHGLATLGVQKFLRTQQRGALIVNADFHPEWAPTEPAVDWLTFDEVVGTYDKILQESIALYEPDRQVLVFVFLISHTGNSVAMWRRKVLIPTTYVVTVEEGEGCGWRNSTRWEVNSDWGIPSGWANAGATDWSALADDAPQQSQPQNNRKQRDNNGNRNQQKQHHRHQRQSPSQQHTPRPAETTARGSQEQVTGEMATNGWEGGGGGGWRNTTRWQVNSDWGIPSGWANAGATDWGALADDAPQQSQPQNNRKQRDNNGNRNQQKQHHRHQRQSPSQQHTPRLAETTARGSQEQVTGEMATNGWEGGPVVDTPMDPLTL
ncbi:hypothetical protein JB92DRAFT_3128370 [Gautieria morchelliformis]|nr:hypothetical protein JB92DRAFT_3128370 [Gautieria morchelliformis]